MQTYQGWTVVLLAFALPCHRQWVSILGHLLMVLWCSDGRVRSKTRAILKDPLWLSLLLFIGINLLSLTWSANPADGWSYVLKYRYLLLAPMVATAVDHRFRRPAFAAFAFGVVVSVALLLAVRTGLLTITDATRTNPAVTMSHLDLSMILAIATLFAIQQLVAPGRRPASRLCWLGPSLVSGIGLLVNIGRSGQLAFFATLVLMVFRRLGRGRWWRIPVAVGIGVTVLTVATVTAPDFRHRLGSAFAEVNAAVTEEAYDSNQGKRIAGIVVASQILRDNPLIGTGIGDNMVEFRSLLDSRFQHLKEAVYWYPHFHNQYVQVATELGLVGMVLLLNIFVQIFRRPFADRLTRTAALLLGSAYFFGFLGDPFFHKQLPVAAFAVILGLLAVEKAEDARRSG